MRFFQLLLLCFSIPMSLIGQESDSIPTKLEVKGYLKEMQNTIFVRDIDSNASANLIHNRLNFKYTINNKWTSRLEIRNRIFYGEQIKMTPNFGKIINEYNGLFNLSNLWVNEKSFVAHSVIDRLLLSYSDEQWTITLGRQRINWGINNIWNPNDIFNAYNFLDFDYEERPGNDAVRIQRNLRNNSTMEIAYKPGKHSNDHTAALLYKFNRWNYDFQLLGGLYTTDYVIGGGWAGNIKNTGFKGEMSYFIPRENTLATSESYSFSLMADQTFKNDWYVSVSGLYNSNPIDFSFLTGTLFNAQLSAKNLFPFSYTFHTTVMKTISPISSFNFSFVYTPEQNTLILVPSYLWNIATNFDLDVTAQSFFGEENTNYGNLATQIYLRGRWSF